MKKILIILTLTLALAGLLFVAPILGNVQKSDVQYFGTAYAGEGGGGGI
jgi:hypothetical protein